MDYRGLQDSRQINRLRNKVCFLFFSLIKDRALQIVYTMTWEARNENKPNLVMIISLLRIRKYYYIEYKKNASYKLCGTHILCERYFTYAQYIR
jgi:hypothetical protein